MGFSTGMMTGLLSASSAMTAASAQQRSLSQLQSRQQVLEGYAASQAGDVEGAKAELEQVQTQMSKAQDMLSQTMAQAGERLGSGAVTNDTDASKTDSTDKTEEKASGNASAEARSEAGRLAGGNKDVNVAAVDYGKGMRIDEEGKTNVAISPRFLEKMAESRDMEAAYSRHLGTMRDIGRRHAGGSSATSSTWSVGREGAIRHHATVRDAAAAAEYETVRQQIEADGRTAFGSAFAGAFVATEASAASAPAGADSTGLLIDRSL